MSHTNKMSPAGTTDVWPPLPLAAWQDTCYTLHRWTQVVGKVRLALAPRMNHWWEVPLYVTARGLTTSPIPYELRVFEVTFDFIDHVLRIEVDDGAHAEMTLAPQSVAQFYERFMAALASLGIKVKIWPMPVEVPDPIRFTHDTASAYDAEYAQAFWRVLAEADSVFKEFRARFIGKCSPVHFFWGGFDLAVTRFNGRKAPPDLYADAMNRETYSHEVSSAGFWPGSGAVPDAAFYAYMVPAPTGYQEASVRPDKAFYSPDMGLFVYMYDDMRAAPDPHAALLEFLQSTYEAGANLAEWDRAALERQAAP